MGDLNLTSITTLNINGLNIPIKKQKLTKLKGRSTYTICKRYTVNLKTCTGWRRRYTMHHGLNVSVPPDSYIKTLTASVMVLGGETFQGWLGHEGGALIIELVSL